MREELDVEYAESRHLFEPLMMQNHRKRSSGKPDEYDMLLKRVSELPHRSDAAFRKAQDDEKERLGLRLSGEDIKRIHMRRERRESEKRAKRAQASEKG
uniref:Uncharacterized protein n=1 Tax=Hemiselmis tepida TaxID=464990 RepID=A0A7S0W6J8_9CRYP